MRTELNGIIVLDKPAGLTSARALEKVKRLSGATKAGHTGTLDPFATGVLVCCLGKATRLSRFLLAGDKTYEGVLRLGVATDTQDATGQVMERHPVPPLDRRQIEAAFAAMRGCIEQTPPVYAALKHRGKPLYRWARQGKPVQKPPRQVTIYDLEVADIRLPDIAFRVSCSAGTYVRTLCADIGRQLGCGGHLAALRRTASAGFSITEAVTLDQLADGGAESFLVEMSDGLRTMEKVVAPAPLARHIAQGRPIDAAKVEPGWRQAAHRSRPEGHLAVVDTGGRLLAVVRSEKNGSGYEYCCVLSQ